MQFTLADPNNPTSPDVIQRLNAMIKMTAEDDADEEGCISRVNSEEPADEEDDEEDEEEGEIETSDETDDPNKPGKAEKRKRKLKLKNLRRKTKTRAYEFSGGSDVVGMVFLEISRIVDLPPERNSEKQPSTLGNTIANKCNSDKDLFRYGSLCGCFTW